MGNFQLLVDQQLLKERLVEEPSGGGISLQVSAVAVSGQLDCHLQVALDGFKLDFTGRQPPLCFVHLPANPVLFALQQINRYCSGVMGLQELASLIFEQSQLAVLSQHFHGRLAALDGHGALDPLSDCLHQLRFHLHGRVMPFDGRLNFLDRQCPLPASRSLGLAAETEEIGVGSPVALGVGDRQS